MAEVRLYASLRSLAGEKELILPASTVQEVIEELGRRFGPQMQQQLKISTVLVNGRHIVHLKGKKTRLNNSDIVSLFPPLGGG